MVAIGNLEREGGIFWIQTNLWHLGEERVSEYFKLAHWLIQSYVSAEG